ncbi:MAG: lysophospholipid acyltransferase family protein [Oscillospiraceae bacterium]|nr:lysophospholipid acyltransferase family protein [Oscillospiraceae bacterium]
MKRLFEYSDEALGVLIRFLLMIGIKLICRPKIYFTSPEVQKYMIETPSVIISNHLLLMDGALIGTAFYGQKVHFMIAKDLLSTEPRRWIASKCRCIPLKRYVSDTSWLKKGAEAIKKGSSICIFPEGDTSRKGETKPFKPGFVLLALHSGAPILPVCLEGPYKIFGKRQRILIDKPIQLVIPAEGITSDFVRSATRLINERVLYLQELLREKTNFVECEHKRRAVL